MVPGVLAEQAVDQRRAPIIRRTDLGVARAWTPARRIADLAGLEGRRQAGVLCRVRALFGSDARRHAKIRQKQPRTVVPTEKRHRQRSEIDSGTHSAPRFFADAMLGTLARWLRAMGLDVLYQADIEDAELVERAATGGRVILTRDRHLVERREARNHLLIASDDLGEQLRQVIDELGMPPRVGKPFGRCLDCNTVLEPLPAEEARRRVPPTALK